MEDYIKGQEDLIQKIKNDIVNILNNFENNNNSENVMFDILFLLKNLKPIKKED